MNPSKSSRMDTGSPKSIYIKDMMKFPGGSTKNTQNFGQKVRFDDDYPLKNPLKQKSSPNLHSQCPKLSLQKLTLIP